MSQFKKSDVIATSTGCNTKIVRTVLPTFWSAKYTLYFIKDLREYTVELISDTVSITASRQLLGHTLEFQHLYFTSDEYPKKGDWVLCYGADGDVDIPRILKYTGEELGVVKIVAATDESLNLGRPSDKFMQKYCELGGIGEVMIEYNLPALDGNRTLKVALDNTITIRAVKDSWNKKEHVDDIKRLIQLYETTYREGNIDKWIEENL